jgi:hypothetical protein
MLAFTAALFPKPRMADRDAEGGEGTDEGPPAVTLVLSTSDADCHVQPTTLTWNKKD